MKKFLRALISLSTLYGFFIFIFIILSAVFNWKIYYIFVILAIMSIILSFIIAIKSNMRQEVKVSWIIFIIAFPGIGFLSFLIFSPKSNIKKNIINYCNDVDEHVNIKFKNINQHDFNNYNFSSTYKYISNTNKKPIINSNCNIYKNPQQYFLSLLRDLEKAKKYILFNFYIIKNGIILESINKILINKIKKGVKIYVIYDHAGSVYGFKDKTISKLKKMGIKIVKFQPLIFSMIKGTINNRNHRKDIIIDGKIGYLGGINIADEFANMGDHLGYVNDQQLKIEGEGVQLLETIFLKDWFQITKQDLKKELDLELYNNKEIIIKNNNNYLGLFDQNNIQNHGTSKNIYLDLITKAKKRIYISTPYFLPTQDIIDALIIAKKSGVDIKILIPGVSDKLFILDLSRKKCEILFNEQIEIYEFGHCFSHSKIAIFDDDTLVMGSTNLDQRSFYTDKQTMVVLKSTQECSKMLKNWDEILLLSNQWKFSILDKKAKTYRFLLNSMFLLSPLL